jgi:hypothetical protein
MTPAELMAEIDGGVETFGAEAEALIDECERNLPCFCSDGIAFETTADRHPVVRSGAVRYCRDPRTGFALAVRTIADAVDYGLVVAGRVDWEYSPSPAPALELGVRMAGARDRSHMPAESLKVA